VVGPQKREDWVGRITYDYDDRYFFETNGAYNGTEKFGPEYRFDFFPSVAAGWLLSNENFIKNNFNWIDKLKIRYSIGKVGNYNVNAGGQWPFATIWDYYSFGYSGATYYGYPSTYSQYPKYNEGNPGNPDLHWEKARKQNLGFEFEALRKRISFTADIFNEYRWDMLIGANERQNTVAPTTGKPAPAANIGEAKSHGAEIELTYRHSIRNKLHLWVSGKWAMARSEVIYKESADLMLPHQKPEGKPIGQTTTGISVGFIESWDDMYSSTRSSDASDQTMLMPGDLIMLDFNSDGKYNSSDDRVPYGYPTYPQNNYGFDFGGTLGGFDLVVRFLGAYNTTRNISPNLFWADNLYFPTSIRNATWSPQYNNADPSYPALALGDSKTYIPLGAWTHHDGSFLRLQSVQLSYNLPKNWVKKVDISNVKLYVNGRNLFLWTKMPDDGVGMDSPGKNYPTKKQINFGFNIQF
jgi:hypothetical protein